MRVLLIDLAGVGGRYDLEVANSVERCGCEVRLAHTSYWPSPELVDEFEVNRLPLLDYAHTLRRLRGIQKAIRAVEVILNAVISTFSAVVWKPDVVHFLWAGNSPAWPIERLQELFLRWIGIKTSATIHNVVDHESDEQYLDERERSKYAGIGGLAFHSEFVRDRVLGSEDSRPVAVVPLPPLAPVDRDHIPSAATDGESQFLFCGTQRGYKGLAVLMEAWALVAPLEPSASLVVAGNTSSRANGRHSGRKVETHPRVRFIPHGMTDAEVIELHRASTVVVLPYLKASQSGAVATAMSLGLAVISTRVGGIAEQLTSGSEGLLVEPGSSRELAVAMVLMLRDPDRRHKFAVGAFERQHLEYASNLLGKGLLAMWKQLHSQPQTEPPRIGGTT